jgi:hypothetical protein
MSFTCELIGCWGTVAPLRIRNAIALATFVMTLAAAVVALPVSILFNVSRQVDGLVTVLGI